MDGRTVRGRIRQSGGGVARNMADALGKLQLNPYLISAVGDENFGRFVLNQTIPHLSTRGILRETGQRTGTCMVLCDHTGESLVVVGDMGIHERITKEHVRREQAVIERSRLVVVDGNLPQETLEFVLGVCANSGVPVWFEPTDVFLASKPFLCKNAPLPSFISPNLLEFKKIFHTLYPGRTLEECGDQIEECIKEGYLLGELVDNIILTLGKTGVMVIRRGGGESHPFFDEKGRKLESVKGPISHRLYKPTHISSSEIVNVSGAGDCFASGFIAAMLKGKSERDCIESGFKCSAASLKCSDTVPNRF